MQKTIRGIIEGNSEVFRPCDTFYTLGHANRMTDMQIHTRDVKSGGCTDNAKETTQDILRKNHEIGQSPSTPQSIICNVPIREDQYLTVQYESQVRGIIRA